IMSNGETHSLSRPKMQEADKFLENIPPYPLDVSIAAYYIRATKAPYDQYLKNLVQNNSDFTNIQESLLKEVGEYAKTRYGIISLSLQRLIKANEDFTGLMLFISLLDSQKIPRDLLDAYKNHAIVDNFIYHLKKYSLIVDESSPPSLDHTIS